MTLHLLSARNLSHRLAAGGVPSKEQALYVIAAALIWFALYYSYALPSPFVQEQKWFWMMWSYEGLFLAVLNVIGVFYCLRRCAIDPDRHFLIDFTCLYAPVTITTLAVTWGVFYVFYWGLIYVAELRMTSLYPWVGAFYSPKLLDILRVLAVTGSEAAIFWRIGEHMRRISAARAL